MKKQQRKNEFTSAQDSIILNVFNKYNNALKYFVSGFLANQQDIEDVCQEAFLRTYKSNMSEDIKKPKSFMFRVAKNLIISDFRKVSSKLTDYVDDIDLIEPQFDTNNLENDQLAQEKLGIMCEAIATLPERCRKVVILRKIYGMSTKEIAKKLGISTVTVSNYITRGMCTYNDAAAQYDSGKELQSEKYNQTEKCTAKGVNSNE